MYHDIFLQLPSIPQAADNNSVLLWVVGALVVVIPFIFTLYIKAMKDVKAAHELRIADRDHLIDTLRQDIAKEKTENEKLRNEREKFLTDIKNSLDAQNKVTGTVANSMSEIKTVIIKLLEK